MAHQNFFEYQPTKDLNRLLREYGQTCLNSTTPAPPDGKINITWQTDSTGNISAYVPTGGGSGITLKTDGSTNGSQSILNLVAGGNVALSDNGSGNVTVSSSGGTSIALKTDGVTNGSQSLLNLISGTNVTLIDNGSGGVTVNASGSGGGGGVNFGNAGFLTFYQTTGSIVSPMSLQSDGSSLYVPGQFSAGNVYSANLNPLSGAGALTPTLIQNDVWGAGWSLGNSGGWSTTLNESVVLNSAQRGITQNRSGVFWKHAVGDTAGIYSYTRADGGVSAASDEGVTAATLQSLENDGYFHGTVVSTTGIGDIAPVFTTSVNPNWTTDGAFMLNITKGTIAGNMTGSSGQVSLDIGSGAAVTYLNALPVTVTAGGSSLPISTAIGIATASIANPQVNAANPVSTTVVVNLAMIGGTFQLFTAGSVVTVAGNEQPEQSVLISASGVTVVGANHQQTLVMKLRNPNNQAIIFQGGLQGQYLSFDANLALSGMRSSYFVFGSLTGTDLIYGHNVAGGIQGNVLPQLGAEAAQTTGSRSGYHLYPGAEVVANTDFHFACILEQNGVHWAVNDAVENPHYPTYGGSALFVVRDQTTPTNPSFGGAGIFLQMLGPGVCASHAVRIDNNYIGGSNYLSAGGPLQAPIGIALGGAYSTSFLLQQAPDSGPIILVSQNNAGASDVTTIIDLNFAAGGNFTHQLSTGTWAVGGNFSASTLQANANITSGGGAAFIGGRVNITGTNDTTECILTGSTAAGAGNLSSAVRFNAVGGTVSALNFDVTDLSGTVFTPLVLDSAGAHVTGALSVNGSTGTAGTFVFGTHTVTIVGGLITSVT
jgi:hypothetical protein